MLLIKACETCFREANVFESVGDTTGDSKSEDAVNSLLSFSLSGNFRTVHDNSLSSSLYGVRLEERSKILKELGLGESAGVPAGSSTMMGEGGSDSCPSLKRFGRGRRDG